MQITLDKIVSIKKIGIKKTIDITVSGDNLFYANNILTHNCGINSSDLDLTNTSESIGLPQTTDLMLALISTPELEELGQIMVKQLKNRYADLNYYNKFVVGIDRNKMRIFDAEGSAQVGIAPQATNQVYLPKATKQLDPSGFKF